MSDEKKDAPLWKWALVPFYLVYQGIKGLFQRDDEGE